MRLIERIPLEALQFWADVIFQAITRYGESA